MTPPDLYDVIASLEGVPDLGEAVDQLAHALQTAGHAIAAGADNELVVAAALHDIGRAPAVRSKYPGLPHEAAGAAYAGTFAGARTAWLIGAHVDAKRYLVALEPYAETLSERSTVTLAEQGGPMTQAEIDAFCAHPFAPEAIALRRWDDAAKTPDVPAPSIDDIIARLQ